MAALSRQKICELLLNTGLLGGIPIALVISLSLSLSLTGAGAGAADLRVLGEVPLADDDPEA